MDVQELEDQFKSILRQYSVTDVKVIPKLEIILFTPDIYPNEDRKDLDDKLAELKKQIISATEFKNIEYKQGEEGILCGSQIEQKQWDSL